MASVPAWCWPVAWVCGWRGAKPAEFYTGNPVFHAKLTLFVVVGLLSIYPTVFLLRQRKNADETIAVPAGVIRVLRAELLLLAIIRCWRF